MKQLLIPGGLIYIAVPGIKFHYHGYPFDWWRWTTGDFKSIFSDFAILKMDQIENILLFIAKKPLDFKINDISNYKVYSILRNKLMKSQSYLDLAIWSLKNWKYLLKKLLHKVRILWAF